MKDPGEGFAQVGFADMKSSTELANRVDGGDIVIDVLHTGVHQRMSLVMRKIRKDQVLLVQVAQEEDKELFHQPVDHEKSTWLLVAVRLFHGRIEGEKILLNAEVGAIGAGGRKEAYQLLLPVELRKIEMQPIIIMRSPGGVEMLWGA